MQVTERFRRKDFGHMEIEITVDDPKTWTQPWSFMVRLKRSDDQVYEYACHEGNHSMIGILAGARAEEAKTNAGATRRPQAESMTAIQKVKSNGFMSL